MDALHIPEYQLCHHQICLAHCITHLCDFKKGEAHVCHVQWKDRVSFWSLITYGAVHAKGDIFVKNEYSLQDGT